MDAYAAKEDRHHHDEKGLLSVELPIPGERSTVFHSNLNVSFRPFPLSDSGHRERLRSQDSDSRADAVRSRRERRTDTRDRFCSTPGPLLCRVPRYCSRGCLEDASLLFKELLECPL